MNTKLALAVLVLSSGLSRQAVGQAWDTSGNGLLQGTFSFREVVWVVGDDTGSLSQAVALYGNIVFDGNGNYRFENAQVLDSSAGAPQNFTATGTYSIAASGHGFLSSPVTDGDLIYGLVSRGIFVGSSTEAQNFNDIFIAAPLASSAPTNASLQGTYSIVGVDFPSSAPPNTRDSSFQLTADGNGGIGAVTATGYIAGRGNTAVTQSISGVTYSVSNGRASVAFGGTLTNSNLIAGTKYLYISADGNFIFGGSPTAWDMLIGVRSPTATPNFSGLYYQAGVFQDESQLAAGFADLDSYYGSLKAGAEVLLAHQRLLSIFNPSALDVTYSDSYELNTDGTYEDTDHRYTFGDGGAIRIGVGKHPTIGVNVAVQAPAANPTGVFIDPTGVLNAASSALFTAGVAPGELISIYGSNLASTTVADAGFPFELGGVQVMVNNRRAPVYAVSANQISAVVPFGTTEGIAAIQVVNQGVSSNTVTSFVNVTAPGVFTQPPGGIGIAAALHSDNSAVTSENPARVGETLAVFVTGLGSVSPAVADGTPGPTNPLSRATNVVAAYVGGRQAPIVFAGLAPQLVGLYQINLTVPTGISSGDVALDIAGPDFFSSGAIVSIAPGNGTVSSTGPARRPGGPYMPARRRARQPALLSGARTGVKTQ